MKNIFTACLLAVAATAAMAPLASLTGCNNDDKYLRVDPVSIEIDSDVLTTPVTVQSSAESWMAYCVSTWLGFHYGDDGNTLVLSISQPNESLDERCDTLDIISGDGLSRSVIVTQRAMNAYFDVSPATLAPFDSQGSGSQTVSISTNLSSWDFTKRESWLTVTRGEGDRSHILTLTAAKSRDLDRRVDSLIVVPTSDSFRSLADTIPIVQEGALLMVQNPQTDFLESPAAGGEISVPVYAKAAWTVTTDDTGNRLLLNIDGFSGTPAELAEGRNLIIEVAENTSTEPVVFTLTFLCGGEEYLYELRQAAAPEPEPNPEPDPNQQRHN